MSTRTAVSGAIVLTATLTFGLNASAVLGQLNPDTIVDPPMEASQRKPIQPKLARDVEAVEVGGEKISLRFYWPKPRTQAHLTELDDGKSGGFFEPLATAARNGDDAAAHRLYEELRNCRSIPTTRAEFDDRVAKARKLFAETGVFRAPGETQNLNEGIANLERYFKRCEGVTPDMYTTATELLRESVERGYDDNRALYAFAIHDTDPNEARVQAELLWQKGYIQGLHALAAFSLPHEIASLSVEIAEYARIEKLVTERREALAALEAKTSPSEFQEATKEAARILRNPSCCRY